MSLYESLIRPIMFSLDPETAHSAAELALRASGRVPGAGRALAALFASSDPALETTVAGLRFPNPVGLAAGFDKDCRMAGLLPALGFGFVEVGTITLRPQPGNPRPRLMRLPASEAILNRMGFNNCGAEEAARRLARLSRRPVPIGINIGLNKETSAEESPARYAQTFDRLRAWGDYFVVNVSSPNTVGLRRLQEKLKLERILLSLQEKNAERKPIFVKLAPDQEPGTLEEIVPLLERCASGVVCTNTTVRSELRLRCLELENRQAAFPEGGLSGAPLRDLATGLIRDVHRLSGGRLPIIGAGGIFSAEDAYQKIRAGASLVQVYTGLIYRGPGLPGGVVRGLSRILREHGLKSVAEAVGRSQPPRPAPAEARPA